MVEMMSMKVQMERLRRTGRLDLATPQFPGAAIIQMQEMVGSWHQYIDAYRLVGIPQGYVDLPRHGGRRTVEAALKVLQDLESLVAKGTPALESILVLLAREQRRVARELEPNDA